MTWFRVDDGFESHPKVLALDPKRADAALALWVKAGSWAGRQLTDGFVPASYVLRLRKQAAADELVRVKLWDKADDGFQFHNWKKHNPSRAEVQVRREKEAEKKRKMRSGKLPPANDNGACPPGTPLGTPEGRPPGSPLLSRPDPTRPDPTTRDLDPPRAVSDTSSPAPTRRSTRAAGLSVMSAEDPMKRAYALVRDWQASLPNIATHDVASWADDWMWLAARPAPELARVVQTLQGSAWATRYWQRCTPRHIRRYWAVYAAGEEPRPPSGPAGRSRPVPARSDFDDLAKQTPEWLQDGR